MVLVCIFGRFSKIDMKKLVFTLGVITLILGSCTRFEVKNRCCNNTYRILTDNYLTSDTFLLEIPQAFTPNGDGLNELFFPVGKGFVVNSIQIKRGLTTVFESENHLEYFWDGSGAKDGRYNYTMEMTTDGGTDITVKGDVCIMRFGEEGNKLPEIEEAEICDCLTADMINATTGISGSTDECVLGAGI